MKEIKKSAAPDYELLPDGRFIIRDYNRKKPFSNFLPGIAGLYGTPMWVFYVNRGQGVVSFGTKNKDNAILEFYPANKAYQAVTTLGFRTFLKITKTSGSVFYEPFREGPAVQSMEVLSHELVIRESHRALGLDVEVRMFTLPGEPLAALMREVVITNRSSDILRVEVLDGLPLVNPYGMNEFFMKHMSRTIEAWMVTENLARRAPFFRLKVDATDRPEVEVIHEGHFYFGATGDRRGELLPSIVDPEEIFGSLLDFSAPKAFCEAARFRPRVRHEFENRTPCAFTFAEVRLAPGRSKSLRSFFGQASGVELVNRFVSRAQHADYFAAKREENRTLVEAVKSRAFTATSLPAYDLYCSQTFLDNVMRGGLPVSLDAEAKIHLHVYSRKHGDLERDYNRFLVEPAYFSQGDGNYRDVNQNRRNDPWFAPFVKDSNIRTFMNLIQLDGFNPLIIKGTQWSVKNRGEASRVLSRHLGKKDAAWCAGLIAQPFTIGDVFRRLEDRGVSKAAFAKLLKDLAPSLAREEKAEHGEGFWIDHWTYNLDLIESYLAIFPEDAASLLFGRKEFTFYDNDHRVRPRDGKTFLKADGSVRQYQSVFRDKEKTELIATRAKEPSAVRTRHGRGEVYRTTLFVKLLCLFANKIASLDAAGVGIEMEADKPSWYDALNGLPGLFGSSLPETFELKRLAVFMAQALENEAPASVEIAVPEELERFLKKIDGALQAHFKSRSANFAFWDAVTQAKEKYREETAFGVSGRETKLKPADIRVLLEHAREKIDIGLEKAFDPNRGLIPTYFQNDVARSREIRPTAGEKTKSKRVRAASFTSAPLPYFLEGPVHALKVEKDPERKRAILKAVRGSGLYDSKLGMYKVNAPMDKASFEVGRARVFKPGWLENESIWLHMEYKFLLEILKSGMSEEFFKDFRKALVPFQPPARYGRSILENSSFIVSSVFSETSLHGSGFVARLSGSTAEFLNMWLLMNVGRRPFVLSRDKKIYLRFDPHLPEWLFTTEPSTRLWTREDGTTEKVRLPADALAFLFLGKTLVVYHNPKRIDTFGKVRCAVKKITLTDARGRRTEFRGDTVPSPQAVTVRDGLVPRIDVELG